jgi:hypothetical protein
MPIEYVKKMQGGERHWKKAKEIVAKEYGLGQKNPRYWAIVMAVAKKMSGKTDEEIDRIQYRIDQLLADKSELEETKIRTRMISAAAIERARGMSRSRL